MFKAYSEYKNSGVEWLGEVPGHWEQKPLRNLYNRVKITNCPTEQLLSIYREYGVIPKDSRDDNHNVASEDLSPYQFVDKNYLVVNKMKAWQGSLAISQYKGIISPAYFIYQPLHKFNHYYIHYLLRSSFYIQTYKNSSKGIRVGQWDLDDYTFHRMNLLIPPIPEQTQIANFLDQETKKIDQLIAKQEKLIELLEEQRKSIISHAVTKGLNPNVEMKDSGVEWLGEVPEHWVVGKIKNFATVNPKITKYALSENEYIEFIPMANIDDIKGKVSSIDYRKFKEVSSGYTAFNNNDVIFAKITPCMENGNCAVIPHLKFGFGFGSTEFIVFRAKDNRHTEFLYFILRNPYLRNICKQFMTGTAGQQRISSEFLANYPVALPPVEEQNEIVDYLEKENQKIDKIIQKQTALIDKLKEYRSSIISHAVTGKIDVR